MASWNVYDFDNTIYDGDCSIDFWKYCVRNNWKSLISMPRTLVFLSLYIFGIKSKCEFKEAFFSYLKYIPNVTENVEEFWRLNEGKIKKWMLNDTNNQIIIISASPEFLLRFIVDKLGIHLIASRVDENTGKFLSQNCYGEEKIRRFKLECPNGKICNFYSDSKSDSPLADLADTAYLVSGNSISEWNSNNERRIARFLGPYLSLDFLRFIVCGGTGSLIGISLAIILSLIINPIVSYICGYILGIIITYILNSRLLFCSKKSIREFGRFFISYIPNFFILLSVVYITINYLHFNIILSYLLSALLSLPISFILVKILAFKRKFSEVLCR